MHKAAVERSEAKGQPPTKKQRTLLHKECSPFNSAADAQKPILVNSPVSESSAIASRSKDDDCSSDLDFDFELEEESSTVGSEARGARKRICQEWVSMMAAANIPLSKTDHPSVRSFLKKHVVNGGAIPGAKQLQECYLQREKAKRVKELKALLKDKPVAIITDEMSDARQRYVLNILAAPLELNSDSKINSFLLDTFFLEKTNHSTVGQAVNKCISSYGIDYNNVVVFNTDNAAYMKKAYESILKGLCPNCVHITCLAHIMNLLGEAFRKPFREVNEFVRLMNQLFMNANSRRGRFLKHLADCGFKPKMCPNPIGTRWNCWYDAVTYHLEHMGCYKEFLEMEKVHAEDSASSSLLDLQLIFSDNEKQLEDLEVLKVQMTYIKDRSATFVSATDLFQSQSPLATSVFGKLKEMQCQFTGTGLSMIQMELYAEGLSSSRKLTLDALFKDADVQVSLKLEKYLTEKGQPGIKFLHDVQLFDPKKLVLLPENLRELTAIPGIEDVPVGELKNYQENIGPTAVKNSVPATLDLDLFWSSQSTCLPNLYLLSNRYRFATINSADAERSFSLYNIILSDRRRALSEQTLRNLVFLFYNQSLVDFFY